MKIETASLSERYLSALHRRLAPGFTADRARDRSEAQGLGKDALAGGIGTLDLARIHEKALRALTPVNCPAGTLRIIRRRSSPFFLEVLTPVEHSTRRLKREIAQRKAAEIALAKKEQHYRLLLKQSRVMEARLRHLSHQVLSAQEGERKKISRELHDQIAQMLAGINVHLTALQGTAAIGRQGFIKRIRHTQRLVEKSVATVHHFARELRPPVLDDLGLIPALKSYFTEFGTRTGIAVRLTAAAGVEALHADMRVVLYRVAQAALTNVGQHAKAGAVTVAITKTPEAVQMVLQDDGRGFDVEHMRLSLANKRLGLIGMRERVEMVGGHFTIASRAGAGTEIRVQIPFGLRRAPGASR